MQVRENKGLVNTLRTLGLASLLALAIFGIFQAWVVPACGRVIFAAAECPVGSTSTFANNIGLQGNSAFTATINVVPTADGTYTIPDSAGSDTFGLLGVAGTWTAVQTFASPVLTTPDINGGTWNGTIDAASTVSSALDVNANVTHQDNTLRIENPATTFDYIITGGAIAAERTLNLPVITGTDTLAVLALAQTFTNKTLTSPDINGGTWNGTIDAASTLSSTLDVNGIVTHQDNTLKIENPAATFDYTVTGAAIAADRILNLPLITGTDTLVSLALAQTLTNKTLTAPNINTAIIEGGTIGAVTKVGSIQVDESGLDVDPTGDADADLLTVGVTGTPTLSWDESEDQFNINDSVAMTKAGGIILIGRPTGTPGAGGGGVFMSTSGTAPTGVALNTAGIYADDDIGGVGHPIAIAENDAINDLMLDSQFASKGSDETLDTSTVLQNDDDLLFAIEADVTYVFHLYIETTACVAAGIDLAWTFPATSTTFWSKDLSLAVPFEAMGTELMIAGDTNANIVSFSGHIATTNAGTVQLQWAQTVSDACTITVGQGSFLTFERVR